MSRKTNFIALGLVLAAAPVTGAFAQGAGSSGKVCNPYENYSCLDTYLNKDGDDWYDRLINYYKLEWGQAGAPVDPNAPAGRREGWPDTPETTPPMPFTEWPYGGTQNLGVTRPASIDSPLMMAIANTWLGKGMASQNMQFYGWIDPGGNLSTSTADFGGNSPAAYDYNPNSLQLDQLVVYLERVPDTVQKDHIDWGFRLSMIYGENYRYTTAYGIASQQLLSHNNENGVDFPMMWIEAFIPWFGHAGTDVRLGRYISLPDIEAQLAPNNYMYTHSITYTLDNYTNSGLQFTTGLTDNFFLQYGVSVGTEAPPWHLNEGISNPTQTVTFTDPLSNATVTETNPLYPGGRFRKDPGSKLSGTGCFRYNFNGGKDNINGCADALNNGKWGYNNLQWYGLTYYHKWNDHWHVAYEFYTEHENGVPNKSNSTVAGLNNAYGTDGGTPFSSLQGINFNNPNEAYCSGSSLASFNQLSNKVPLTCGARSYGTVAYFNWSPNPLNNFSIRPEFYWDKQGQRTGIPTRYTELGIGWQHWLSPQVELRPEVTYYRSWNVNAFNIGLYDQSHPKNNETVLSGDVIWHF
ncbi:MAG: outer membrane beta-barrel protein [Nevskia sp.]|nr:outer membrane beta-barrel protein [Nevskia sp.]